ncbi:MAG: 50S ribosomal protein L9 [Verrucomicrobiota bacterium]
MSVEVILMKEEPGLGVEGDVVKVSEGYARNYLLPRKVAAPVTDATRRQLARSREQREANAEKELAKARELANRLGSVSCTVTAKVGEEETLYGSVSPADIFDALKAQGIEDVGKNEIILEKPIKELGVYDVPVKLHPEVETSVKVWVVEE